MSASLASLPAGLTTLDRLTCPDPSSADVRLRAVFWTRYAARERDTMTSAQYERVLGNVGGMLALARRMDDPAPIARFVPVTPIPGKRAPVRKGAKVGAAEFWDLASRAVRAIAAVHGLAWRHNVPHETIEVDVPARLRSYIGPMGGKISWRRDHRLPAAAWWPGGVLPDGVEASPVPERYTGPMGDEHPSHVRCYAARREQVEADQARWAKPYWPKIGDDY